MPTRDLLLGNFQKPWVTSPNSKFKWVNYFHICFFLSWPAARCQPSCFRGASKFRTMTNSWWICRLLFRYSGFIAFPSQIQTPCGQNSCQNPVDASCEQCGSYCKVVYCVKILDNTFYQAKVDVIWLISCWSGVLLAKIAFIKAFLERCILKSINCCLVCSAILLMRMES